MRLCTVRMQIGGGELIGRLRMRVGKAGGIRVDWLAVPGWSECLSVTDTQMPDAPFLRPPRCYCINSGNLRPLSFPSSNKHCFCSRNGIISSVSEQSTLLLMSLSNIFEIAMLRTMEILLFLFAKRI